MVYLLVLLALQVLAITAKTVTYNWNIDWVTVSPDGFTRPAVGINGAWPCPSIMIDKGDRVVVNLKNNLGNETTAIHFHGIFQIGSAQMDGPAMVSQCPIPPGSDFVYDFVVDQPGTYWYHAHIGGQYLDGLRGPLIVHDPNAPYQRDIDEEAVLTLSDWYHDQAPPLIRYFQSSLNEDLHGGSEPVPNATLINESQNVKFPVKPGKSYLFRIVNMGGFAGQYLQFDEHDMTVVEVDGVYTKPHRISQLFITVGQRYSVIIKMKSHAKQNYGITASMDKGMFDDGVIPEGLDNDADAWLVYDESFPLLDPADITYVEKNMNDLKFVPQDNMPLLEPVDQSITLNVAFGPNDQNQNRGSFNGISYVPQKVPTLYTALSAPQSLVTNPLIYGNATNTYVLPLNSIVELVIVNYDGGAHPFHLHSHNFQVLYRTAGNPDDDGAPFLPPKDYIKHIPKSPMRRDTVLVYGLGSAVIRFKVDNPGITLFHCHIEWHVEAGLTMTFVEAPQELQKLGLVIPISHKDACTKGGVGMEGNAAGHGKRGNETGWLDLSGAPTEPPINSWGSLVDPPNDGDDVHKSRRMAVRGMTLRESRLRRFMDGWRS